MEEMASLLYYQETIDEMKQKLMYTNLELENLKVEKSEEMRKNKEYVKQLMQLLNMVCQERDEAKDQLQKLLNNLSHVQVDNSPNLKANSSITESNSFSETHNNQSHNSSLFDAFNGAVSSPEFSNNNTADSNPIYYDCNVRFSDNCVQQLVPKVDEATLVIDNVVKGKTLPQKGKLLKSVIEAGPLLHTLLVSGQLPQWRNPPQLKSFTIPPVSIKGFEAEIANLSYFVSRSLCSHMSNGTPQMLSTSMLNFANSGLENQGVISAGANRDSFVHLDKRQRLQ